MYGFQSTGIFFTCYTHVFVHAGFMFTFMMFIAALRKNVGFILLLGFLSLTFLLLAIGEFTLNVRYLTYSHRWNIDTHLVHLRRLLLRPVVRWVLSPLSSPTTAPCRSY